MNTSTFDYTITPGVGIGQIKLGMSLDRVHELLGEPRKTMDARDYDIPYYQDNYYDTIGLTISYDFENGFQVKSIDIADERQPALLNGFNMMGVGRERLTQNISQLDPRAEVMPEGINCPTLGIFFFLDEDPAIMDQDDYDMDAPDNPEIVSSVTISAAT